MKNFIRYWWHQWRISIAIHSRCGTVNGEAEQSISNFINISCSEWTPLHYETRSMMGKLKKPYYRWGTGETLFQESGVKKIHYGYRVWQGLHINGLLQDCRANALGLLQSCTKPSIYNSRFVVFGVIFHMSFYQCNQHLLYWHRGNA